MSAPAQVPVRRVLERVTMLPGIQPLRVFPVLLPMWRVEVRTVILDAQPYEIFDHYVVRAVERAGLREPARLAIFFGVGVALVERTITFLESVGHLRREAAGVVLTDLGRRSVAEGCRYVVKEDRQTLYFDGFTSSPLPRTHYAGTEWCAEPELELADRTRFRPVTTLSDFQSGALDTLAERADRAQFNLPATLTDIKALAVGTAWLPAYIVECSTGLLVFVKAVEGPDRYLESVVAPFLADVLMSERRADDVEVWRTWLAAKGFAGAELQRRPNGVLRAVLPAYSFQRAFRLAQLGSFETREHTFAQLWCEDVNVRREAVLVRAAAMTKAGAVRSRANVEDRLTDLAQQLEVEAPGWAGLYAHVKAEKDQRLLSQLDKLAFD